jgi:hypothetical protein
VRIPTRTPRLRSLTVTFLALTLGFLALALAYWFAGRADLPAFLPHSSGASHAPDANDVPMGAVALLPAGFALCGAHRAHTRRSWMRSREWHRKHGRV